MRFFVFTRDEELMPGKLWITAELNDHSRARDDLAHRNNEEVLHREEAFLRGEQYQQALAAWDAGDDRVREVYDLRFDAYASRLDVLEENAEYRSLAAERIEAHLAKRPVPDEVAARWNELIEEFDREAHEHARTVAI